MNSGHAYNIDDDANDGNKTTAAAGTTKQQQPKQYASLTGTGQIMKSAQIHKYTDTHS
jgi:hypothetical protein